MAYYVSCDFVLSKSMILGKYIESDRKVGP